MSRGMSMSRSLLRLIGRGREDARGDEVDSASMGGEHLKTRVCQFESTDRQKNMLESRVMKSDTS